MLRYHASARRSGMPSDRADRGPAAPAPSSHRPVARRPWLAVFPFVVLLSALAPATDSLPTPAGATALHAQAVQADVERIASVEGITEYRLDNGLTVLLFPDASQSRVTVNVTYLVGSKHEGTGETGMAHLLEHLVFKGTDAHPDIPEEITQRGGNANGTTSFERTNYFQTMPPTEENLAWSLGMEADRMVNSWIRAEDLESEMTVVRNEWESGENAPAAVLQKRVLAAAYQWHGYGRTPIGARSDIEGVPIERLQAFYRKYYQPDNAVLIIAGRFEEERALELIRETFGAIPRPDRSDAGMQLYPSYTREPSQDGERRVEVRRVGDTQVMMIAYHIPAGTHEDWVPLDLLSDVLGDSPSGRLYRALVETELATSVSVGTMSGTDPGLLFISANLRMDQSLDEAEAAISETLADLEAAPPTEAEVERARADRLRSFRLALNNVASVGLSLSEWEALGDWRMLFIRRDRVEEATAEDVARVATRYLLPSNRTVGRFIPQEEAPVRAEIPEAPDVEMLAASYTGREAVAEAETFEPVPENIESRTIRTTLPNGMELALLPKATRGEAVVGTMTLRFGDEQSLMGRRTPGLLVPYMLTRGTEQRSRQEYEDALAELQSTFGVSGNQRAVTAQFQSTRGNLAQTLRLIAEVLREPAFDAGEFEILRRGLLAQLENRRSDPGGLAGIALDRHLNPYPEGHPLYTATTEQQIEYLAGASVEELRRFHEEFYGAGPSATFALVGDFDATEAEALVGELFDDWVPATPHARVVQTYHEAAPGEQVVETPDRANAYFLAGLNLPLSDDDPDYPALLMANYLIGGGFLNSRLAERVRQQEGLSYGIASGIGIPPMDEAGRFMIQAISAPENVDRVEAAVREELEILLREGFTEEETRAGIEGWLQSREVGRANDQAIARMLDNGLYLDRTLLYDQRLDERISELSARDLSEAVLRHLDLDRMFVVKAGDFAGAGPDAR